MRIKAFLAAILALVQCNSLVSLVTSHAPETESGHLEFPVLVTLRIHLVQRRYAICDTVMEDKLGLTPVYCVCRAWITGILRRQMRP